MAEEKQELTLESKLVGGKETADGLEKIGAAQDRVTKTQDRATESTNDQAEAQERLNSSEGDFIALDNTHAGVGDTVLVNREGNGARQVLNNPDGCVISVIVGIVDSLNTPSFA